METSDWVRITREDGETVGWLEPLDPEYEVLRPHDVLGHVVGDDAEWSAAEATVLQLGLAHLAGRWRLDGGEQDLTLVELSEDGIHVADWLGTKALTAAGSERVDWPDAAQRLRPAP